MPTIMRRSALATKKNAPPLESDRPDFLMPAPAYALICGDDLKQKAATVLRVIST